MAKRTPSKAVNEMLTLNATQLLLQLKGAKKLEDINK